MGGVVAKFAPELTHTALPVNAKSPLSMWVRESPIADDANIHMTSAELPMTTLTVRMMIPPFGYTVTAGLPAVRL
jgi:hypothetical protein